MAEGITPRHQRSCSRSRGGLRCTCTPTFQAQVWDPRTRKRLTETKPTEQEAIDWRADRRREIREGTFRPGRQVTIRVVLDELIAGMRAGTVRNRKGLVYKPSVIRDYARDVENYLKPAFGSANPRELRGADVQRLVDRMVGEGLSPSSVRNKLMPLRVCYRRLLRLEEVLASPMDHLELPADEGKRLRIAPPAEAAELVAALERRDRTVWAVAVYAGLRVGEIQALGAEHVDLATGRIEVEWNWDRGERRRVRPKSDAGVRAVPVPGALRDQLLKHRLDGAPVTGLLFGRSADVAFSHETLQRRADRAWSAAGLRRLTFHDCRHTYASLMIAAGVNAKALSTYMGHSSIAITLDRYGHLFPGNEEEAADLLDAYLDRANTAARKVAVSDDG